MDRKSEVFLNLINTFIYQVEAGEAYAQTPDVSLDDIEYVGFTLIVGAGDSGTYHCHAYGYEAESKSHIMTLNAGGLIANIKEFAKSTEDDSASWKTCIIEIPENIEDASADFLYGRDAEPWVSPSLRISEFVRPGTNADKDIAWNQSIYQALHGVKRTEGLPKKRYVGAIEEVAVLSASVEAELDETLSSAIEELFSHEGDFVPVYSLPADHFDQPVRRSLRKASTGGSKLLEEDYGTTTPETESMFSESPEVPAAVIAEVVPLRASSENTKHEPKKEKESKSRWGLGRKKAETPVEVPLDPVVEIKPAAVKKNIAPPPKTIPKNEILPSFVRFSEEELKKKKIECSMASIIIYLQPPDITSYGFWYHEGQQGHWMPESFDLDDAMDAFLRDTIPDPKNHWDVCIVRMDFESHKITTEFLKGRPGYAWMEPMSHRSKSLSEIARYKKVQAALVKEEELSIDA